MLIGKGFNNKCEKILKEAAKISDYESGYYISVEKLNKNLAFDRKEIRYYFEYLNDQKLIELATIGGPFLYGHITITNKGITRIQANQESAD